MKESFFSRIEISPAIAHCSYNVKCIYASDISTHIMWETFMLRWLIAGQFKLFRLFYEFYLNMLVGLNKPLWLMMIAIAIHRLLFARTAAVALVRCQTWEIGRFVLIWFKALMRFDNQIWRKMGLIFLLLIFNGHR